MRADAGTRESMMVEAFLLRGSGLGCAPQIQGWPFTINLPSVTLSISVRDHQAR